jgi:hypothetical protein
MRRLKGRLRKARSARAGEGPRTSRAGLRLVHRGLRHARSERGQEAARRATSLTSAFKTAPVCCSARVSFWPFATFRREAIIQSLSERSGHSASCAYKTGFISARPTPLASFERFRSPAGSEAAPAGRFHRTRSCPMFIKRTADLESRIVVSKVVRQGADMSGLCVIRQRY